MKIYKSIYDLLPNEQDTLTYIVTTLTALEESRLMKLYPNQIGKPLTPRTVLRFQIYQQAVLHRVIDLTRGILDLWETKNVASAYILLRALNENTSVIYDTNHRLEQFIENNDFENTYKLIFNLQYGTRINERIEQAVYDEVSEDEENVEQERLEVREAYTAQQILNVFDRISKNIPKHRELYEHLCEYAHPNWDGLMGLYCEWEDKHAVNLSNEFAYNEKNGKVFFNTLRLFLKMFLDGYDGIVKKYPAITKLCIDDLKNQGQDTKAYEEP